RRPLDLRRLLSGGNAGLAGAQEINALVGRTPWSARDALVPQPEQWGQYLAGCQQADGGVGRGPGGPPHQTCRCPSRGKTSGIGLAARPPTDTVAGTSLRFAAPPARNPASP